MAAAAMAAASEGQRAAAEAAKEAAAAERQAQIKAELAAKRERAEAGAPESPAVVAPSPPIGVPAPRVHNDPNLETGPNLYEEVLNEKLTPRPAAAPRRSASPQKDRDLRGDSALARARKRAEEMREKQAAGQKERAEAAVKAAGSRLDSVAAASRGRRASVELGHTGAILAARVAASEIAFYNPALPESEKTGAERRASAVSLDDTQLAALVGDEGEREGEAEAEAAEEAARRGGRRRISLRASPLDAAETAAAVAAAKAARMEDILASDWKEHIGPEEVTEEVANGSGAFTRRVVSEQMLYAIDHAIERSRGTTLRDLPSWALSGAVHGAAPHGLHAAVHGESTGQALLGQTNVLHQHLLSKAHRKMTREQENGPARVQLSDVLGTLAE